MKTSNIDWGNLRFFLAVARTHSAQEASRRLDIDHSTLTRRLHRLEKELASQLFNRTPAGHELTPAGYRLLEHVERIESSLILAESEVGGDSHTLMGQVRLGATEAFGTYFLAPHLSHFCEQHPAITVELLTVPRFINLSKREADLAINVERPHGTTQVVCKLSDYRLKLYASRDYLSRHALIRSINDLSQHRFIGYVDELSFSTELQYLHDIAPDAALPLRSTSVVAQCMAALQGKGVVVLPCFLAADKPDLVPLLEQDVEIIRTFWLAAPGERREIARVRALWNYLREIADANQPFLMGETSKIVWLS